MTGTAPLSEQGLVLYSLSLHLSKVTYSIVVKVMSSVDVHSQAAFHASCIFSRESAALLRFAAGFRYFHISVSTFL